MAGPVTRLYGIKRALLTRATSSRKRDARQCSPTRNTSMSRSPNAHSDTCDRVIIYAHNRTIPRNRSLHRLNQHIGAFRLNATGVSFHIL